MKKRLLFVPLLATFLCSTSCSTTIYKVNVISDTLGLTSEVSYKGVDFFAYIVVPDNLSPDGKKYIAPNSLNEVITGNRKLDPTKKEYLYQKQQDGNAYITISQYLIEGDITIKGEAITQE